MLLIPNAILRFPEKPEYCIGKITAEVSRPRKFLCFKWMGRFKKEQLPINYLRYETHS